jgi:hypothetical protein
LVILLPAVILLCTIILLRRLGAIWLFVGFLFGTVGGFFLVLPAFVGLLSLFWLFLLFGFLLRLIFIGLLPGVAGRTDKENHQRGTKDEFHFDSSVCFFVISLSGLT